MKDTSVYLVSVGPPTGLPRFGTHWHCERNKVPWFDTHTDIVTETSTLVWHTHTDIVRETKCLGLTHTHTAIVRETKHLGLAYTLTLWEKPWFGTHTVIVRERKNLGLAHSLERNKGALVWHTHWHCERNKVPWFGTHWHCEGNKTPWFDTLTDIVRETKCIGLTCTLTLWEKQSTYERNKAPWFDMHTDIVRAKKRLGLTCTLTLSEKQNWLPVFSK